MRFRRALVPLVAVSAILLAPRVASAHPLGNFTVNTSARIELSPGAVGVRYVLDLAEIPTVQAMPDLDPDGDGTVSGAERSAFASGRAADLLERFELAVDGEPVALAVAASTVALLPGQGGLATLRLEATFTGAAPRAGELSVRDGNAEGRIGWHEITAVGVDGVAVERSSVPSESPSDELRAYPDDLLRNPLDVREATVSFAPGTGMAATTSASGSASAPPARDRFAELVGRTGPLMLLALALAFGFGALHALGPGHGKTLIAAYLVGSGGRARHAAIVGLAIAAMHTASVLALGAVVLLATEISAPERVYPWLGLLSGVVALGLGVGTMVVRRRGAAHDHGHPPAGARDSQAHDQAHPPADAGDAQPHAHPHAYAQPRVPAERLLSRRGLVALAVAGGILPSPTALVVLLGSVALQRVGYGLALIGAFSLGLAAALTLVGALALRARDVVVRRMSGRLGRLVPRASAGAMTALGIVMTARALASL